MKTHSLFFSSIFFIILTVNIGIAQDIKKEDKATLDSIVNRYYDLNLKIFQANSTVETIDKTFELFTDDFTYIHPKYGGTYTREALYNGYLRNKKNGGYNGKVKHIKIENKIIGLNAVVVEKRFIEKEDNAIKEGELEMTLFEFKDGKISRIIEYW